MNYALLHNTTTITTNCYTNNNQKALEQCEISMEQIHDQEKKNEKEIPLIKTGGWRLDERGVDDNCEYVCWISKMTEPIELPAPIMAYQF